MNEVMKQALIKETERYIAQDILYDDVYVGPFNEKDGVDCAIHAVDWYLNNVWHNANEEHDKKRKIACLQRNGHIITGLFNEVPAPFEMWAYTDDLLPKRAIEYGSI